MVCARKRQAKEGSHAFTEAFYRFRHRGSSMGVAALLDARLLKKDHGPRCTATVVWNVVLRTAARLISIFAACRDLSDAPSQQAVFDALEDGLPRTCRFWKIVSTKH